jgi:hypothetical protein
LAFVDSNDEDTGFGCFDDGRLRECFRGGWEITSQNTRRGEGGKGSRDKVHTPIVLSFVGVAVPEMAAPWALSSFSVTVAVDGDRENVFARGPRWVSFSFLVSFHDIAKGTGEIRRPDVDSRRMEGVLKGKDGTGKKKREDPILGGLNNSKSDGRYRGRGIAAQVGSGRSPS